MTDSKAIAPAPYSQRPAPPFELFQRPLKPRRGSYEGKSQGIPQREFFAEPLYNLVQREITPVNVDRKSTLRALKEEALYGTSDTIPTT